MATRVKHRRGTTSEIMSSVPAIAEWWHNSDDNSIHTGDGMTLGGHKIALDKQSATPNGTIRTISDWLAYLLAADARNVDAITGNKGVVTGTKDDFDSATIIVSDVQTVLLLTDSNSFIYTAPSKMSGVITSFNSTTPSITVGGTEHTLELVDIKSAEQSAQAYAAQASNAADSAAVAGNVYPTTAAGLAATSNGELFLVKSGTRIGFADLYLNNGTAVFQNKTTINSSVLDEGITGANTDFLLSFESFLDESDPDFGGQGYWQAGNTIVDDPNYKHTGLIPIETGRRIVWRTNLNFVKLFEPDRTPISGTLSRDKVAVDGSYTVVVPSTFGGRPVGFVSFSTTLSSFDNLVCGYGNYSYVRGDGEAIPPIGMKLSRFLLTGDMETQISSIAGEAAFTAVRKRNSVTPESLTITDGFTMALDRNDPDFGEQGYVSSNGELSTAGYQKTNFIRVHPGMAYAIKNSSTSHIGYYDENKVWLESVLRGNGLHIVPELAGGKKPFYIRHGFSDSQVLNKTAIMGYGRSIPDDVTGEMLAGESSSRIVDRGILAQFSHAQNIFSGKKVALFGDSITVSVNGWHKKFSEILGTVTKNYAVSGGHWENFTSAIGNQEFSKQVDAILADSPYSPDIIMIAMGTNSLAANYGDFDQQVSGAESSADRNTIYGGMRSGIERLLLAFPNAKVVLMTPLQRTGHPPHKGNWAVMNKAVKDMGAWFALPVIDCGNECGISYREETIAPKYLYDGLHPNAEGADIQGAYTASRLKALVYPE